MTGKDVLEALFDKKLLDLLRFFLDNPEKQYYLRELAKLTKIPPATIFRLLKRLKNAGVIEEIKIKKFKIYQLKTSDTASYLQEFMATKRSALDAFIAIAKDIPGVDQILLHGQETAERASLLLVGTGIDTAMVQAAVIEIKRIYNYNILHLNLEPGQFEQMTAIGLYPGKRVTLFRR